MSDIFGPPEARALTSRPRLCLFIDERQNEIRPTRHTRVGDNAGRLSKEDREVHGEVLRKGSAEFSLRLKDGEIEED